MHARFVCVVAAAAVAAAAEGGVTVTVGCFIKLGIHQASASALPAMMQTLVAFVF